MKSLVFSLLFISVAHAQTQTCFRSSPDVGGQAQASFCIRDFGTHQSTVASVQFPGADELVQISELHRGLTINGDPQIIYSPARLQDGRKLYLMIRCAYDYGIFFSADVQDGTSRKNIFAMGRGFKNCQDLWALYP